MPESLSKADVTGLLRRWRENGGAADDRLIRAVEGELRRIAAGYMRRERADHTLQPTALVNEAYLRLVEDCVAWEGRAHFYGIAARVMRQILVDHARKHRAAKRGSGRRADRSISKVADPAGGGDIDVLALHLALEQLATLDARQASIVELRYFGGLTEEEVARVMELSPVTIRREVASAKFWLGQRMRQGCRC
ncbi:MAG TPA: ECF-type sigma factor [Vicinamibacterales bacterium]